MSISAQLIKAGQWFATFLLGSTAVAMGANACDVLFNHTQPPGHMYSFATAAAVSAYAAHYVYSAIQERERLHRLRSPDAALLLGTAEASEASWLDAGARSPRAELVAGRVSERVERACPFCAEPILAAARLCKHCRSDVSATATG